MNSQCKIQRHPERAVPEQFEQILLEGRVAHVGFCLDGCPYVLPFSYYYSLSRSDRIYLHGAQASRTLQHLAKGPPVCIEVTLVDGLVYSRTAMDHSMNYRSAICFGHAQLIQEEAEKAAIFEKMVSHYFPGRQAGRDYDHPPVAHLEATLLLEVRIERSSAKARSGGPNGPNDHKQEAPGSAGVVRMNGQ